MLRVTDEGTWSQESFPTDLDELAREGARRMLVAALQAEVADYVDRHQGHRDERGHALVVRNGRAQARKVTLGAGTVEVRAPRVHDRREDHRFTSSILPPWMRRSPKVAEVLPILYLRGLSTGDFQPALTGLLGEEAAGLSPANINRLVGIWEAEWEAFRTRDLSQVCRSSARSKPGATPARPMQARSGSPPRARSGAPRCLPRIPAVLVVMRPVPSRTR